MYLGIRSLSIFAEQVKKIQVFLFLQFEECQVGHVNVNLDIDDFVISEPKWLKFGFQGHFLKIFGYAKFQLFILFTFRVMKLLVDVFCDFH